MFISFLAGDSIIIGVDSDGAVGKAADSQYQNLGTVPCVIRIFAHSSLFGDTKSELTGFVCLASLQARLRGCQTNLAKCIATQHQSSRYRVKGIEAFIPISSKSIRV
ncbi:hypothetical protein Y032_0002g717 [Ancylostoma ceylanicum]|uniref:Uncharacterized protein n=1 Tax=Ancylostoma ceylanicum TaxID=53326 RepID=A0A016W0Y4_9BILA|nr:hypothetical protein Y032_0002g717 [Ancylostoma ceylanicum]